MGGREKQRIKGIMKIVLQNLTKKFPGPGKRGEDVVAVRDFNYEFPDGKLVGLLGPSGCGKSTTLFMICGLEKPTEGKIFFGQDNVTALAPEDRGVGVVFQNYALYPHLTVEQNILFPLQNLKGAQKLSKQEMQRRAEEAAHLVQIEKLMQRRPSELSGGQQQRVAIARAIVKMPRVLLLDEPLSNLDARLRLQTREEIRRIQRETGITTVFVTHDQEEAMSISDEIVVMKEGVVQQTGKISGGMLWIGEDAVLPAKAPDGEVYVGIRPEGFVPDENGALRCEFRSLEVMGRDVSVVSAHPQAMSASIRSIVASDSAVQPENGVVRFSLKPKKVLLFDKKTEERVLF